MTMRFGVFASLLVCVGTTPCVAQVVTAMDQVQSGAPASVVSAAPAQIARAGRDATTVRQLPADAKERAQSGDDGMTSGAAPQSPLNALAPQARNAGSVDPEEIARLLDRGEAASIDAAAAIASGVNVQRDASPVEDNEGALRRRGADLPVPPRS